VIKHNDTGWRQQVSTAVSIKEMADLLGKTVQVKIDGFSVPMEIHDVKIAYGNKRLLVSPVGGHGEMWVDASRADVVFSVGKPEQHTKDNNTDTDTGKVRAWARERGIHVNHRGRIPTPIMDQYLRETVGSK
jgi:hypothetical protein